MYLEHTFGLHSYVVVLGRYNSVHVQAKHYPAYLVYQTAALNLSESTLKIFTQKAT